MRARISDSARRTCRRDPYGAVAVTLLSLLWLTPGLCHAQERSFPYQLDPRDRLIVPAGLASAALGLYLVGQDDPITLLEIRALDRQDVNAFDRGATYNWSTGWDERSDWSKNTVLGASVLLSATPLVLAGEWSETVTLGTIFLETFSLVFGVTTSVKALAGRTRPYAYNTSLTAEERYRIAGPDDSSVRRSFISGHSAMTFAGAPLLSTVYADLHGPSTTSTVVWASSLSLAAFTAYARVQAGKHFPTDVIVGAAVGTAIGYWIPALHRVGSSQPISVSAGPGFVQVRLMVGGQ